VESGFIEDAFADYFASQGLFNDPTAVDGRSDNGSFIAEGIPAGGLFTGAEQPKTEAQVAQYGGIAGAQLDPCYHAVWDTFAGSAPGRARPRRGLAWWHWTRCPMPPPTPPCSSRRPRSM
jgi:Zn-dependent M28 family amino/carboxypeptidase